jgi:serpin B
MNTILKALPLGLALGAGAPHALSQPDLDPALDASSQFAFDLYAQLATENSGENLFFSPYSVVNALAMTAEGARGKTALEMGEVFGLQPVARTKTALRPWDFGSLHAGIGALNERFNRADKAYELEVANAIWGERTFDFNPDYIDVMRGHYGLNTLIEADFKTNPDEERVRINEWVEKLTRDRIKDLLPDGSIDPLTRMVLVNAIYFKGDWKIPFKKRLTERSDFLLTSGGKSKIDLMEAPGLESARYAAFEADGSYFETPATTDFRAPKESRYPSDGGFAMIELPYDGGEMSMVVIAPNDPEALGAIEEKLSPKALAGWLSKLQGREVNVFLPKFKAETSYEMNKTLSAMGMADAFDMTSANFDGMIRGESKAELAISGVFHKAFVAVDEEGTEAAAATAVVLAARTSVGPKPFTPDFRADRPFLYLIRDTESGAILFLGRMVKPD